MNQRNESTHTDELIQADLETRAALEIAARHRVPALSPSEKVEMFEAAWSARSRAPFWKPWLAWLGGASRTATTFACGLACGVIVTLTLTIPEQESVADIEMQDHVLFTTMKGKTVEDFYPELENPVLVLEKPEFPGDSPRRVVYGTMHDGAVQVVWNN